MQQKSPDNKNGHIPVLFDQVLTYLDPRPGEVYLDLTAGYGGHASAVLERTLSAPAVLVDRDHEAVDYLKARYKDIKDKNIEILHVDFLGASQKLLRSGRQFDLILADLGLSSPHLNTASRGFSIQSEGPLDMRMDRQQELTAETIVNTYSEAQLTELFREYGEDPRAKQIARAIVQARPLHTTQQLARVVTKVWPLGKSRVHPATRAFQSLRIEVNSELDQLKEALPLWIDLLKPGGRIGAISFHSLEDRLVKQAFAHEAGERYDARLKLLTKHPVQADATEIVHNPRARSAKLRAAVKIKI